MGVYGGVYRPKPLLLRSLYRIDRLYRLFSCAPVCARPRAHTYARACGCVRARAHAREPGKSLGSLRDRWKLRKGKGLGRIDSPVDSALDGDL